MDHPARQAGMRGLPAFFEKKGAGGQKILILKQPGRSRANLFLYHPFNLL